MSDLLDDLIAEGHKAKREETIAKAAKKTQAAKDKTPLPDGPPIRRDIYQQLDWQPLSLTLIVTHTTCDHCSHSSAAANPYLLLERYHKRHGRHLVELSSFRLLTQAQIAALPRRIEERYIHTPFCQHCFLGESSLCLEPTMTQLPTAQAQPTNAGYPFSYETHCGRQDMEIWSSQMLSSDTSDET